MDSADPAAASPIPGSDAIDLTLPIAVLLATSLIAPLSTLPRWGRALLAAPGALALLWLGAVLAEVPEPYLDEVFHIPQAQQYCAGRWSAWDDKITTPPGLYVLSWCFHRVRALVAAAAATASLPPPCSTSSLRSLNAGAIFAVAALAASCRQRIESGLLCPPGRCSPRPRPLLSAYAVHTASNVALFPVLFFFSALYYTDVLSTAAVLLAFRHQLGRLSRLQGSRPPAWPTGDDALTVLWGLAALCMRQTNVFWVVFFMGGLEAVDAVRELPGREPSNRATGRFHDPPLSTTAWPADMLLCAVSVVAAAACHPLTIFGRIWPHLTVLGAFGGFVVWNGGVVLGDKSNHIATIHLPQMLYIWPFFAFFSAPLLLSVILPVLRRPLRSIRGIRFFSLLLAVATSALAGLVVRYNTIIHPFTLADNRHYMFYVFRYTIRRSWPIRYLLVVPYGVCLSLCWAVMSASGDVDDGNGDGDGKAAPAAPAAPTAQVDQVVDGREASHSSDNPDDDRSRAASAVATSTGLLLLLSTALSLVTAPLVEPRYFIIPWVMWRLLIPAWQPSGRPGPAGTPSPSRSGRALAGMRTLGRRHDVRLFLETGWFLLINFATARVFLRRPYVWVAEDGTVLDGGRLQRFMW